MDSGGDSDNVDGDSVDTEVGPNNGGAMLDVKEDEGIPDVEDLLTSSDEVRELDQTSETPALGIFRKMHPIGIVAGLLLIAAVIGSLVSDTERLIGNVSLWQWIALVATLVLSMSPPALNVIRVLLEALSSVTKRIVWVLAWGVFFIQLINVVTRYLNPFFEQDILFGELASGAWQMFALIALLGLNHGVKAEVNPRIDFWWADWTDRTKAWLDFVMHTVFFLPFVWVAMQVLQTSAAGSLGRRRGDGVWPSGWRVWESWEQGANAGDLPVGPIKTIILIGFTMMFLQVGAQIIKTGFVLMGQREYAQLADRDEFQRIE